MRTRFSSEIHTGTDGQASRSFSLLETRGSENEDMDGKAERERGMWTWKVHEIALHEASQREGPLKFDRRELLLKQLSDEVSRKVQEKVRAARSTSYL
jgi:hypothetical protein